MAVFRICSCFATLFIILTLVVVPVMYSIFDKIINKVKRGKKEQPVAELMTAGYQLKVPHGKKFDPSHI
jgi:hydrophobic/amphiphilic exporter-1 (mainly G- bacteria), HAE1 family